MYMWGGIFSVSVEVLRLFIDWLVHWHDNLEYILPIIL